MKFQNPSFIFFLNGRTNKRTSRKQYAPHFFKEGGRTGLAVRASDSRSGDPGSILGRVGVLFP